MMNPVFDEALDDKPWSTRERAHTNTHKHERTYTQAQSTRRHGHGSNHEHERARTAHPRTHTARHTNKQGTHAHAASAQTAPHTRARTERPLPRAATHHGDRTGGNSPPGKPPSSYAPKGAKHAAIRPAQMGMTPGTWHAGYGRCWGRCACGQQGTKRAAIG